MVWMTFLLCLWHGIEVDFYNILKKHETKLIWPFINLSLSLSSRIMILTSKQLFHYLYWTSFANNYEQLAHRKLPNSFWTHICTFSPWKRGKTKEMVWDLPIPSPWLVDQIFCFHLVARPNLVVIKGKQEGGTPIKKSRLGSIVIFWKYLVKMNVISDLEFWS